MIFLFKNISASTTAGLSAARFKQPWQFGTNNAKTALRLLLHVRKTKLRHLTNKFFDSNEKTYLL